MESESNIGIIDMHTMVSMRDRTRPDQKSIGQDGDLVRVGDIVMVSYGVPIVGGQKASVCAFNGHRVTVCFDQDLETLNPNTVSINADLLMAVA